MNFADGVAKLTLLDYPGRLAATVFAKGCNFRCPFCHNASLVVDPDFEGTDIAEQVLAHLENRKGRLTGLCVTGGEPLLQKDLISFLQQVKQLGYDVKLDTNGSLPDVLSDVLELGLADAVAVDIKNAPGRYASTAGLLPQAEEDVLRRVEQSVRTVLASGADVEFRTTVVREFHRRDDLVNLARWLADIGEKADQKRMPPYYLQAFKDTGDVIERGLSACSAQDMELFRLAVLPFLPHTFLRGI